LKNAEADIARSGATWQSLFAEAAKKRKKVWIASRHASLAVAMTGTAIAFFNSLLEHAGI